MTELIAIRTQAIYSLIELLNHPVLFQREFAAYIFQPLTREFWIVWLQKNEAGRLFAVLA